MIALLLFLAAFPFANSLFDRSLDASRLLHPSLFFILLTIMATRLKRSDMSNSLHPTGFQNLSGVKD